MPYLAGDLPVAIPGDLMMVHQDMFSVVEFETITTCNLRCSYCPNAEFDRGLRRNERKMEDAVFQKLIDDLADMDFAGSIRPHFYGEPLLDKRLGDMVAHMRARLPRAEIKIYTNGELLSPERFEQLVRAGVNAFTITQHRNVPPKHIDAVWTLSRSPEFADVHVEFRRFSDSMPLMNRGGVFKVKHAVDRRKKCDFPSEYLTLDYRGNVVLCCNDYHSSVIFGNITETSLKSIWNNEDFAKTRRKLLEDASFYQICRDCEFGQLQV